MAEPYDNPRLPSYMRIWLYAMHHEERHLDAGELRDATGLDQRTLSRGLTAARRVGLLTPDSHARWLVPRHLSLTAALVRGSHLVEAEVHDAS